MGKLITVLSLTMMTMTGCLTNYYGQCYTGIEHPEYAGNTRNDKPISLRVVTTEDDVRKLIADSHVPIGYSSFIAPYTAMSLAIDTANKHGASLVLLDIRPDESNCETSVMYQSVITTGRPHTVQICSGADMFVHDALFFRKDSENNEQ